VREGVLANRLRFTCELNLGFWAQSPE